MIEARDETRYLDAVVNQFRQEAQEHTGFELRKRLWHSCVVVCEVTEDYMSWHGVLGGIALDAGINARELATTVQSARRKAGVA